MEQAKILEKLIETKARKPFDWHAIAFDKQQQFINDPARLKASFTTRRGAKSYADGIYILKEMEENPGCNCLYVALTRMSAKAIIWKDVFKHINERCKLDLDFNESELRVIHPNGSYCYVGGVDVDEDERKKLFGRKYKLVVIDEAALYGIDLRDLVYVVLRPAIADLRGTIVLSGMASNITSGLFYDITTRKEKGWSLHQWSAYDNPYIAKQWDEELEFIKINQPELMDTARFRQAYLNEWVVDEEKLVYRFNEQKNTYVNLPTAKPTGWTYVLGVDTGWEDDNAFVLTAFHENLPELYVLKTFNRGKMTFDQVVVKIQEFMYDAEHAPAKVIIDGANKQGVESMRQRSAIPFEYADKIGKVDFIEMLNGDLVQGRIKINHKCESLIQELKSLIWHCDGETILIPKKEEPRLPNHLCFVAGTKVNTWFGPCCIEDIKLGDLVLTRSGYKPVLRAGVTGHSQVIKLHFSNGCSIVCTPDHPIYTHNRGFVLAIDLTREDQCEGTDKFSGESLSTVNAVALTTLERLRRSVSLFTERFMNFIMDQYLEAGTFTIKTTTKAIMILQILRRCQKFSTWMSIGRRDANEGIRQKCSSILQSFESWLKFGMHRLQDISGINSMRKHFLKRIGQNSQLFAPSVVSTISETNMHMVTDFAAQPNVLPNTVATQGSIMKQGAVNGARHRLKQTSIPNNSSAPVLVTREIQMRSEVVYGLSVSEKHEYFANGILVSNCDAFLYSWRMGYHYHSEPVKNIVTIGSREWYQAQAEQIWEREREHLEKIEGFGQDDSTWPAMEGG